MAAGITGLATELIELVAKAGIPAAKAMLDSLSPEARKALAWIAIWRFVGFLRAAGPEGAPWLAGLFLGLGLPKKTATEIAAELLKQLDAELEATRPL